MNCKKAFDTGNGMNSTVYTYFIINGLIEHLLNTMH